MLDSTHSSTFALGQAPTGIPVAYTQRVCWQEYQDATNQTTTLTRSLRLRAAPLGRTGERLLGVWAEVPQLLRQEDQRVLALEATEGWAMRLAALYAQVQGRVNADGEWVEVLNYGAIAQTWAGLRAELVAETTPDDPLLASLLASVDQQLADPSALLRSLRYDYLYQTLAGGWPAPPSGPLAPDADGWSAGQPRCFAAFLPGTDVWFEEQTSAGPAGAAAGTQWLAVRGTLDATRTDLATALAALAPGAEPPQARYQARLEWDAAAALPAWLELRVSVRRGDFYHKEYTLTLARV